MRIVSAVWAGGFLVALLTLSGCGDTGLAEVKGKVNVDGQPAKDGAISFFPKDGKASTAGGFIKNGHYTAKVPVGVMKVTISVPKVVGMKKLYAKAGSPELPMKAEGLPARYNTASALELDVKPGANEKDWDLKSK